MLWLESDARADIRFCQVAVKCIRPFATARLCIHRGRWSREGAVNDRGSTHARSRRTEVARSPEARPRYAGVMVDPQAAVQSTRRRNVGPIVEREVRGGDAAMEGVFGGG